jgi:hypothetical protein
MALPLWATTAGRPYGMAIHGVSTPWRIDAMTTHGMVIAMASMAYRRHDDARHGHRNGIHGVSTP